MAQREKEETEFKVPETLTLCTNGCGFPGNPATNNMCQNCFKPNAGVLKPLKFSSSQENKPRSSSSRSPSRSESDPPQQPEIWRQPTLQETTVDDASEGKASISTRREVYRCSGCRRKVGLTGFRCRCGDLFCSEHRYSDRHVCSYDYKTVGREAIARENPVVKAAKIVRV